MRRSRLIIAVMLMIPGLVLLTIDFGVGGMSLFWKVLAWALLGGGAFMVRRETKRRQTNLPGAH